MKKNVIPHPLLEEQSPTMVDIDISGVKLVYEIIFIPFAKKFKSVESPSIIADNDIPT